MKKLDMLAAILLVIGGLNWGLVGLFGFDLVQTLLGAGALSSIVYAVVGVAAVYQVVALKGIQRRWKVRPVAA